MNKKDIIKAFNEAPVQTKVSELTAENILLQKCISANQKQIRKLHHALEDEQNNVADKLDGIYSGWRMLLINDLIQTQNK